MISARPYILALFCLTLLISFVACGDTDDPFDTTPDGLVLEVTPDPDCLEAPAVQEFSVEVFGGNGPYTYTWTVNGPGDPFVPTPDEDFTGEIIMNEEGDYTVSVTVKDRDNKSGTEAVVFRVVDACDFSISIEEPSNDAMVNAGEPVTFRASVTGGTPPYTYTWKFEGTGLPDSNEESPTVTFPTPGTYTIKLTVTDSEGNSLTNSIRLFVKDASVRTVDLEVSSANTPTAVPANFAGTTTPDGSLVYFGSDGAGIVDPVGLAYAGTRLGTLGSSVGIGLQNDCATCPAKRAALVEVLVRTSSSTGTMVHYWDSATSSFAVEVQLSSSQAQDITQIGSDATQPGFFVINSSSIYEYELDETDGYFDLADNWNSNRFPDRSGTLQSAFARDMDGSFLAISNGSPSQLYLHDRTPGGDATKIADIPNGGRRVRVVDDIFAATCLSGDAVVIGTWSQADAVAVTATIDVDDAPWGVGVARMPNNNYVVVVTSSTQDSVTWIEVSPAGQVVNQATEAAPVACSPVDPIFVPGTTDAAISCGESVVFLASPFGSDQ